MMEATMLPACRIAAISSGDLMMIAIYVVNKPVKVIVYSINIGMRAVKWRVTVYMGFCGGDRFSV